MNKFKVVLVALGRYQNFQVRTMHAMLGGMDGVEAHTIFFKNYKTNVFTPETKREEELFAGIISRLKPDLVGFSVLSPYAMLAERLTAITRKNSSAPVIWGGIHPTIFPENCIRHVDMLCVGEGDGALTELVNELKEDRPCEHIRNLWINKNGNTIKNELRPLLEDLDSIPFPSYADSAYYFIESNRITHRDSLVSDDYCWVQTSRGCPYACSFCVNSLLRPLFKGLGPLVRRRSVESVISEIRRNLSMPGSKAGYVIFIDESFGKEKPWLDEFVKRYKKEIGLPFFAEYNPKDLDLAMLGKLARAGMHTMDIGIQSGVERIRNRVFARPGRNDEIIKIAGEAKKHKIKIKYDLILDNPYDTEETLRDTIEFLLKLPKPLSFNLFSLQYFPNYPLTEKAVKDGHISPEEGKTGALIEKTTKNWLYIPRFRPYGRRQIFQNIVWLIVNNYSNAGIIKQAVFEDSLFSKSCLLYLNIKAVLFSRIFGAGGFIWRNPWIAYFMNALKYIIRCDFKAVRARIKKHIKVLNRRKVL